jgi:hypothetical protein
MTRWLCAAGLLLLAGCGKDIPPSVADLASSPFDGQYKGIVTACDLDKPDNHATRPLTISVMQGKFSYQWSDLFPIQANAVIQADGVIHGSQTYSINTLANGQRQTMTVTGHLVGSTLDLQVQGPGCTQTAILTKIANT